MNFAWMGLGAAAQAIAQTHHRFIWSGKQKAHPWVRYL
ncbi:hypothetical protein SAMN05443662_1537 [Sulfurivirga caldicuralii]|uniref:Uncharacterized protein n=1 Tax=Sulfurivirga caldicuralii TaxID=364032 RepID=A0A1N6GX99_9GAMM|nr:hypothetical protein SAMN05443662_1537 [Sulfurivirga caldicuralii]